MPETTFPLLTTLVVLPLLGAAAVWLLPASARRWSRHVAVGVAVANLAVGLGTLSAFDMAYSGFVQLGERVSWIPAFGVSYALGVNGVGMSLVLLSVFLVPIVLLAAWREQTVEDDVAGDRHKVRHYMALILVLEAFVIAVFCARDLFLFYVLFEAMLFPVYFMIGIFGGPQRRYAAVKFLLYSLAGGLVMLVGVIALYLQGPGGPDGFLIDNLVWLDMPVVTGRLIFVSFFVAFAIKAPLWPVHTWLPDAVEQAPVGTNVLLVCVLDKVGAFGMLTLCLPLFPAASLWAAPTIMVLAVVSILYGAFLAIGQEDLMRLIAYMSVSHVGAIVLGIFALTTVSIQGAVLSMLTQGLSGAALFLVAGFLVRRWGTVRIADYGGLQKVVPVLAGTFLVAGLSALSLPGLAPFVGELLVLVGTFATHQPAAVIAALGMVLAALYVLVAYQRVFAGPVRDGLPAHGDLSVRERWVVGPLVVALLAIGLFPGPVVDLIRESARSDLPLYGSYEVLEPTASTDVNDRDGDDADVRDRDRDDRDADMTTEGSDS